MTFDSTGIKFCSEVGFGAGGGIEVEQDTDVGNTDFEMITVVEATAALGGVKVGVGTELTSTGCLTISAKGQLTTPKIDPLTGSIKAEWKNGKLKLKPGGKLPIPGRWANSSFGNGLSGKVAGRFCAGAKF